MTIFIPLVFELLQGPLLVTPQATARRPLTPSLIKLLTLMSGFRHCGFMGGFTMDCIAGDNAAVGFGGLWASILVTGLWIVER
ncbi:hypothetical protein K6Y31_21210 [Motilimonas cestriensis]|uniref:Uncharacterized protein n=1 Tax=Motilimonas cestriensis TaxID=2742685 RepID=A0ABS8WFM7_9GAMM|nr:hypothetical protein [Motilimonas cestriensis]MCE2597295.1 hypothetical protein [Motilimonas cestriensis]